MNTLLMAACRRLKLSDHRRGLGSLLMAFSMVLLTACQPTDGNGIDSADSIPTKTITDVTGFEVAVPEHPDRVVTLSELDLDAALALGITPVGSTSGRGQKGVPRYLDDQGDGIELVGPLGRPNLDRLIALSPDLIMIGAVTDPMLLEQLRKVAPTVVTYQSGDSWKKAFKNIAQVLGREQQFEQFMNRYQQRVVDVKSHLGKQGDAKVSVVRWIPQGPGYMLSQSFSSLILADLELQRPDIQHQDGIGHSHSLSLEALDQIDGDWLFIGTLNPAGDAVDAFETAKTTPVFQQLKAVKQNRMIAVDGSLWTSLGGPQAAMAVLDDIESAMTKDNSKADS